MAWNCHKRRGIKEPDSRSVAVRKQGYVEALPALVPRCDVPPSQWNAAGMVDPAAGLNSSAGKAQHTCAALPLSSLNSQILLPDWDLYENMKKTVGARLTHGKSGVHGLGVFARVPHKAGDWVVEYAGQTIRSVILDLREKRSYATSIGTGTFTFQLPQDMCVDATRAGNIAHLMNHSCSPNCFSAVKTIYKPSPDGGFEEVEKVILFAKRDIKAHDELTYDYR